MKSKTRSLRFLFCFLIITVVLGIWLQCSHESKTPVQPKETKSSLMYAKLDPKLQNVVRIQNRYTNNIMSIPGVVGMGIGLSEKGKEVIRVFTLNSDVTGIPKKLETVPVEVKITGMFVFFSDPTARFPRPVPIGVSTGHPDVTAGTIACRVKNSQGQVFALSNNHVYANSNNAQIGDNILQPGAYDNGINPDDAIGTLYDFETVRFDGYENTIDAAITLSSPGQLNFSTLADGYGIPSSTTVPYYIGQKVQKFGRTTKWTHGEVTEINVTLNVCYKCNDPMCWSCEKLAKFVGQIAITSVNGNPFSDGGDSGSLIITDDANKNPVALLFAGNPAKTIANPIDLVLQRFNVTIDDGGAGDNNPPVADFSYTTNEFTANFTDNSSDSDGSIVSWNWDFGDGTTSSEQNVTHTYSSSGSFSVALTVMDDQGAANSTSQNIYVGEPPNNPPTADFSYTSAGLAVTFTDKSTDSDGNIVSWNWTFGDGLSSTEQNPTHTYSAGGFYTVKLTVTDDDGDTGSITKSVNVSDYVNEEPVANFTYTTSNLIATFQDQSTDPDGNIVAWNWDFGDGGTTALQNPIHIYSASGTYTVTLTVTDNNLATNSISKNITVSNGTNNPPVANFSYTKSALTVNFQDQSTDSDGNITAWNWDFGDGNSSVEQNPVHNYTASGTYTVTLSVTDNGTATNSTSQNITVTETTNNPPVADFTFTTSDLTVTFNDQSTDTDGTIVAWNWNFGDGSTSTEQNPIHTYTAGGNFTVQLSVTDNNGDTDIVSKNVTVEEQANLPPIANFNYTTSDLIAYFYDQSTDPDGNIIGWNWDFGDGGTTSLQNPVHIYSANGTYTVTLTVTDNNFASNSYSQNVTVSKPVNNPPVADFTYSTSDLIVTFTDQSTDPDGNIIAWNWNFGDGGSSGVQNPVHIFPSSGTYSVTLTVTDNKFVSNSTTKNIIITDSNVNNIILNASGYVIRGRNNVDLNWSGATTNKIEVFRNENLVLSTKNDGLYTDTIGKNNGTYIYKIREQGSSNWSNEVTVNF